MKPSRSSSGYSFQGVKRPVVQRRASAPDMAVFEDFRARGEEQLKKMEMLQKTSKLRRQNTKINTEKARWAKEYQNLSTQEKKIHTELTDTAGKLCIQEHDLTAWELSAAKAEILKKTPGEMRIALTDLNEQEALLNKELAELKTHQLSDNDEPESYHIAVSNLRETLQYVDEDLLKLFDGKYLALSNQLMETTGSSISISSELSPNDVQLIRSMLKSFVYTTDPAAREAITESLAMQRPAWSRQRVKDSLWEVEKSIFRRRKTSIAVVDRRQKIQSLTESMVAAMQAACKVHLDKVKTEEIAHDNRVQQELNWAKLEALHHANDSKNAEILHKKIQKQLETELELTAQNLARDEYLQKQIMLLKDYKSERRLEEERAAKEREIRMAEEAIQHASLAMENMARTEFRSAEYKRKIEKQKENLLMLQEAKLANEEHLNNIASSVAPEVARCKERATGGTVSSQSVTDPLLVNEVATAKGTGYTTADILKDGRFKLTEALFSAGLLDTAYARRVISNAAPVKQGTRSLATTSDNPLYMKPPAHPA
eukprot:TRINITY_DN27229_c0_g1_i1.p1 TRINITY_DN27229_c0_g1~~TRINITY_DN27229_c0_g1_i1.p1  ORF type:complete len:543 (+),score=101.87 TRINITY_DN27229_c0_g1_i1:45-1673(+)